MSIPRHQRGMATLLIILLTGLAVAVASLSGVQVLNGSRQRLLTTHAQTAAQGAAWRGVEIVRQFLQQVDLTTYTAGGCGANDQDIINLMVDNQTVLSSLKLRQARVTRICEHGEGYRVTALITGEAGEERNGGPLATSTVEVVYEIAASNNAESQMCLDNQGIGGMSIYRSMAQGGHVTIKSNQNSSLALYVKGNVSGGATFDMPDVILKVDGTITLDGSAKAKIFHANGDINLSGSAYADQLLSRGNINIGSNTNNMMQIAQANGNITISNSQSILSVKGKGSLIVNNSPVIGEALLEKSVSWSSTGGAATSIIANDDVYYGGSNAPTTIRSGNAVTTLKENITVYENDISVSVSVPEVPVVTVTSPTINVAEIEDLSNYAFHYDGTKNLIRVSVRNIQGLAGSASVDFYLFNYNQIIQHQYWTETKAMGNDYLCPVDQVIQQNGSTSCNVIPPARLCGKGAYDGACFSYSSGKWGLTGAGEVTAPGILWFDGNLSLAESGTRPYFVNTLMATGSITASGSGSTIYAPAFAGYSAVCNNTTPANAPASANSVFNGLYPTNLCGDSKLNDNALSNVALIAGSYSDGGDYIGGDISIGSGTTVLGNIMAGNIIETSGSTTIRGSVIAASLGNTSKYVSLSASTVLDFTNIPEGGNISVQPCELDGSCVCSAGGSSSEIKAAVRWSRYL